MGYSKEDYQYYKSKGICVKCRRERALKGRVQCLDCLERDRERKSNKQPKISKEQREYNKRKKQLCVAFKVCRECQSKDATKGQVCLECWIKRQRRNKNKSKSIDRSERKGYGLCYLCGRPSVEGYNLCQLHLEPYQNHMKNIRNLNTNTSWRNMNASNTPQKA